MLIIPLESFLRAQLSTAFPGAHLVSLGALMMIAAIFMKRGITGVLADMQRRFGRGGR